MSGSDEVLKNWERIKQEEKKAKSQEKASLLSGVPTALPALLRAYRVGQKVARVGFEFPNLQEAMKKVAEEWEEVQQELDKDPDAIDSEALTHELGDLLFSIVNVTRQLKLNPETALQTTTRRFQERFEFIETELKKTGRTTQEATLEEMDALWEQAKQQE